MNQVFDGRETKHTPGPWCHQSQGYDHWIDVPCDAPKMRQDICRMTYRNPDGQANARLIAAAPEMLVVLLGLVEYWNNGTPVHAGAEIVSEVRAAIAKALGE